LNRDRNSQKFGLFRSAYLHPDAPLLLNSRALGPTNIWVFPRFWCSFWNIGCLAKSVALLTISRDFGFSVLGLPGLEMAASSCGSSFYGKLK